VAIKILEKDRIKDQADLERVNREITILKKVRHPNVVQLYDVTSTPNHPPIHIFCFILIIIKRFS
jgi:serine/threonine protein kinase